jgi:hypothetical protein
MTIILYLAISIIVFSILSVSFKRSRKHKNSMWQRYLEFEPHETDEALLFITMVSLFWPVSIPIGCILLTGKRIVNRWHRWMDK